MKVIRAAHLGICFGVRDAIELARQAAAQGPVTVLGDLVHNEVVLESLRQDGVAMARNTAEVRTQRVMITAHGASERRRAEARSRNLEVHEATCPLVHVAHRAVNALVAEGFHPVIVGKAGHAEVLGLTEDLAEFDVVLTETDIAGLRERRRFGVVAQTTQPIERVRSLVSRLRVRFPASEVRFMDTVCQPTKQRQQAAIDLAQKAEVVVVIGGTHSNNTHELVRTCGRQGARVHQVQTAADLREDWFLGAKTVGITAGTSTPDSSIAEVEAWVRDLAGRRAPLPAFREQRPDEAQTRAEISAENPHPEAVVGASRND